MDLTWKIHILYSLKTQKPIDFPLHLSRLQFGSGEASVFHKSINLKSFKRPSITSNFLHWSPCLKFSLGNKKDSGQFESSLSNLSLCFILCPFLHPSSSYAFHPPSTPKWGSSSSQGKVGKGFIGNWLNESCRKSHLMSGMVHWDPFLFLFQSNKKFLSKLVVSIPGFFRIQFRPFFIGIHSRDRKM
jgi:hypothetical protein